MNKKFEESEKIFNKYLFPIHQKFLNHTIYFKKLPELTSNAKINLYTLRIMKDLEKAKDLCLDENTKYNEEGKINDEKDLKKIDLDYETIHSEILNSINFAENDSGLSDFGDEEEENPKKKIFEIEKIEKIVHKSVENLFIESQKDNQFKPLAFHQKELKNIENINKEKDSLGTIKNIEIKTQDNTVDFSEELKEKDNLKINNEDNENNSTDIILEKKEEIINFKKYNFFTDPYSNYNNFTKKYKVEKNPKKRYRETHPFLKTFNPKFLKKENIDKKIFRRFRKFVKALYKEKKNIQIFSKNELFWERFYFKNLLPPVKITYNDKLIEHKSFNNQYLIWLFSQEGTTELFQLFIKKEAENVINNFIKEYNLVQSKEPNIIEKLRQYINYIPEIYSLNNGKKNILEEDKDGFNTNEFSEKNIEEENFLESFESENTSNPFNLNFEMLGKKQFKEALYEDDNYYNYEKLNNYNDYLNKTNRLDNCKSEKFRLDDSLDNQLSTNFYRYI